MKACWPDFDDQIISLDGDRVTGYAAALFVDSIQLFQKRFKNYTLFFTQDKYGDVVDPEKQIYDGCIGRLQRNEQDFALAPTAFGVQIPNVSNSGVFLSSMTNIVSAYNNSFDSSKTDVMQFFTEFDLHLWLTTISLLVVLILFQVYLVRRKRKRRSFMRWMENLMTATLMKQFSSLDIPSSRLSVRFIFLMINVFIFLIHFFLSSLIKTELVVQKQPDTISTYEEIVEHQNCRPVWLKGLNTHWEFENSDPKSSAFEVWKRGQKAGLDRTLVDMKLENLHYTIEEIKKKEAVLLIPNYLVDVIVTNECSLTRQSGVLTDFNMWYRADPSVKESLATVSRSSNISQYLSWEATRFTTLLLEHDLFFRNLRYLNFVVAKYTGNPEVEDCMANRIIYPEHNLESINLSHYAGLWKLLGSACLLVFFVFVSELVVHHIVYAIISYVQMMCRVM